LSLFRTRSGWIWNRAGTAVRTYGKWRILALICASSAWGPTGGVWTHLKPCDQTVLLILGCVFLIQGIGFIEQSEELIDVQYILYIPHIYGSLDDRSIWFMGVDISSPPRLEACIFTSWTGSPKNPMLIMLLLKSGYFTRTCRLKPSDLKFMYEVGKHVPIVPVVTKADTMTIREAGIYRSEVASKIANPMLPGKDLYLCSHSH
jgi:hypothetical protein